MVIFMLIVVVISSRLMCLRPNLRKSMILLQYASQTQPLPPHFLYAIISITCFFNCHNLNITQIKKIVKFICFFFICVKMSFKLTSLLIISSINFNIKIVKGVKIYFFIKSIERKRVNYHIILYL